MATAPKTKRAVLLAAAATLLPSVPASAQVEFSGNAQLRQVLAAYNGRDFDTAAWLEASVGGRATFDLRRLQGSVGGLIGGRVSEFGNLNRNYRLSADAALASVLIREHLYLSVGGQAQQYERSQTGFIGGLPDAGNLNTVQLISGYAAPRFTTQLGRNARFDATYRIGAVTVDGIDERPGFDRRDFGFGFSGRPGRGLSDSVTQSATGTAKYRPGGGRLELGVLGNWVREDFSAQDQEYRAYRAAGTAAYEVSQKLEVNAVGGYEDILNTQRAILFDPVTGLPVLEPDGNFAVDPSGRRRTSFEISEPYGTVGFRYAPSRRTLISVDGGYRYGGRNVNAQVRHQRTARLSFTGSYVDRLTSVARQLTQDFAAPSLGTPVTDAAPDPFPTTPATELCPLGFDPLTGGCLGGPQQSLVNATFRSSRAQLTASYQQDRWNAGGSLYYNRRSYVDLQQLQTPDVPNLAVTGVDRTDTEYGLQLQGGYIFNLRQSLRGSVTASRGDTFSSDGSYNQLRANANYRQALGRGLFASGNLSAGFRGGDGVRSSQIYIGSIGIGYQF